MATTWIFEHEGDRCYVQRQDGVDQISILTWSNLEQGSTGVHSELEAVQLIQALNRNWSPGDGHSLSAARNADRAAIAGKPRGPIRTVAATVHSRSATVHPPDTPAAIVEARRARQAQRIADRSAGHRTRARP